VVLRVVLRVVVEPVSEIVLGIVQPRFVQPGVVQALVQSVVQRVVLITLEAETQRVRHRVVQAVETLVQPVVTEVVREMTGVDVPAECGGRPRLGPVAERVEQSVLAPRFMADLLTADGHIVWLVVMGAEPKPMVVLTVLRIVHSHDAYRPLVLLVCPGLQRDCHPSSSSPVRISSGTRAFASMGPWNR
jgi:hypothetical protein